MLAMNIDIEVGLGLASNPGRSRGLDSRLGWLSCTICAPGWVKTETLGSRWVKIRDIYLQEMK